MKDAIARDRLIKEHDILCFEMEAAGLMSDTRGLPRFLLRERGGNNGFHMNW